MKITSKQLLHLSSDTNSNHLKNVLNGYEGTLILSCDDIMFLWESTVNLSSECCYHWPYYREGDKSNKLFSVLDIPSSNFYFETGNCQENEVLDVYKVMFKRYLWHFFRQCHFFCIDMLIAYFQIYLTL